jgi:hypothetical protein
MHYLIYKLTNKHNGKIYIGCHKTINIDDGYMGSGKLLDKVRSKYGVDCFDKEILFDYSSAEEMFKKESELIELGPQSYNLKMGGNGGFDYINNFDLNGSSVGVLTRKNLFKTEWKNDWLEKQKIGVNKRIKKIKESNPEAFKEIAQKSIQTRLEKTGHKGTFNNKQHSLETKEKISKKNLGKTPWNKGIKRTDEEKQKISNGVKNSRKK